MEVCAETWSRWVGSVSKQEVTYELKLLSTEEEELPTHHKDRIGTKYWVRCPTLNEASTSAVLLFCFCFAFSSFLQLLNPDFIPCHMILVSR